MLAALTLVILRDTRRRRSMMFGIVVGTLLLLFLGSTLFADWLRERVGWFLLYWAGVAWLTVTILLLALYDLVAVRRDSRAELKRLRLEMLKKQEDETAG